MSVFRYAICNETFQDWPLDRALDRAVEVGYSGIEVAPFTLNKDARAIDQRQRNDLRREIEDRGLEVVGLHWLLAFTEGFYLTSPDAAVRRRTADYLVDLGTLCRDLGAKIMVLGSPKQRNLLPGVEHEQATEWAAEVLRDACARLQEKEVTLAVEPLGPEEGDFLLTADEALQLIARVDSSACRLHLDVKALSAEPKPMVDVIRALADALVHFHANDPNKRGPGMGEVDFIPILQTLLEVGYRGWISVEVFDYDPGVDALVSESLRYLRSCEQSIEG